MKRVLHYLSLPAIMLAAFFVTITTFAATAYAAGAVPADSSSPLDYARPIVDAFKSGEYPFAASLVLVLAVALARKYGASRFPWLTGDTGGATLTLLGAFGGAMAAALSGGAAFAPKLAWTALGIAVSAAGGYTLLKKLAIDPLLNSDWYKNKAPDWFKALAGIALFMFTKPDAEAITKKAEAAGDAAVKADPAPGADSVAGKPEEL